MTFSPALKGLISAILMVAIVLVLFYTKQPGNSSLHYLPYAVYALGIIWSLMGYRRSASFTGRFGDLFSQGFRCFIVVTLVMVAFTAIFMKMNPQFAVDNTKLYKEQLLKEKSKTPAEIEKEVADYKDQFNLRFISASIFRYLITGAAVTAVCAGLLTRRNI